MSNILANKRGLIFGALNELSLAWKVALRCKEEGAKIVLTNYPTAVEIGDIRQLAEQEHMPLLLCDATNLSDLQETLRQAQKLLGGQIDFVLHAVAQSQNLRRHRSYDHLNYDYFMRTLDISALSLHKLLQTAMEMDAIAEGGSVVTLTYIAAERYSNDYNDMGDAKAMLQSIVRQMGAIYGQKKQVRVNAISQSATPTKASTQWQEMEFFYLYQDDLSPLGSAKAEDCADLCVALFSDLTRKVTMQCIYNDGGFSNTLMTRRMVGDFRSAVVDKIKKKQ